MKITLIASIIGALFCYGIYSSEPNGAGKAWTALCFIIELILMAATVVQIFM